MQARAAHEAPHPLMDRIKQTLVWFALLSVLSGGVAWLFSIKEAANEAVRVSGEAKAAADKANVALENKADKQDVQQMKQEIREDLADIKRDLRSLRADRTQRFGPDVTVRHVKPAGGPSSPQADPPNKP